MMCPFLIANLWRDMREFITKMILSRLSNSSPTWVYSLMISLNTSSTFIVAKTPSSRSFASRCVFLSRTQRPKARNCPTKLMNSRGVGVSEDGWTVWKASKITLSFASVKTSSVTSLNKSWYLN